MLNELHYFFAINDSRGGMRANAAAAGGDTVVGAEGRRRHCTCVLTAIAKQAAERKCGETERTKICVPVILALPSFTHPLAG